jgi:hypothetical protein
MPLTSARFSSSATSALVAADAVGAQAFAPRRRVEHLDPGQRDLGPGARDPRSGRATGILDQ